MTLAMVFAAVCTGPGSSASAVHKVKDEPISILTTKEMEKLKKVNKDMIYIEKMRCVIDNNKGKGHVVGTDYEVDLGFLRYKGKKLKKGAKTETFFILDLFNEDDPFEAPVVRYDYLRAKVKKGKKYKWDWVMINVEVLK